MNNIAAFLTKSGVSANNDDGQGITKIATKKSQDQILVQLTSCIKLVQM